MKNLVYRFKAFLAKNLDYCNYILHKKELGLNLWEEISYILKDFGQLDFVEFKRTVTATNVLIIKAVNFSSKKKIICKIPLDFRATNRLKENYKNLVKLNTFKSNFIPVPIASTRLNERNYVFIETLIEGPSGHEIMLNSNLQGELVLNKSKQFLYHIRKDLFNHLQSPTLVSNEIIFREFQDEFRSCANKKDAVIAEEIFNKIKKSWKEKKIEYGVIHGDFWVGNVIFSEDSLLQIKGIIDWDKLQYNAPILYDEMHLQIYYLAIKENKSLGHAIIYCIKNNVYQLEDIIIYWLLFVIKSYQSNNKIINDKRWYKRNILDLLNFLQNVKFRE